MCGIFGVVGLADAELGERVAACLRHRGPDDYGVWTTNSPRLTGEGLGARSTPITLVNTRLSIIDLSPAGHQPMSNEDGSIWIAYNGEAYNFQEVRLRLEGKHVFRSHTDTEVLIHAYEEWGDDCLQPFRGMFAFGLWDVERQRLFAARDRLGEKPFYYAEVGGKLVFASELKAVLASGLVRPEIDLQALHHYLTFYAVPAPYTMLRGVRMLLPGHCLIWEKGRVKVRQYWDLPAAAPLRPDPEELRRELRRLLEESIHLRMIADVPVGAFLSGGVDSSAVVGLMSRISGERLKTFSIGFAAEGRGIDERSHARVVADRFGADHHEVIVTGRDVADQLDRFIEAMDQPTGDGLNTYLVSQATARHVKVALSGLGGDELFAGYLQSKFLRDIEPIAAAWRWLPAPLRDIVGGGLSFAARAANRPGLARAAQWMGADFETRYTALRTLFDEEAKTWLYSPETRSALNGRLPSVEMIRRYSLPAETDAVQKATRFDLKTYMAYTLLRDTDALSMAHSLEVRVPLIDHQLVEFAARLPSQLKIRGGRTKFLLTQALADILPPSTIARRKQGFEMPVETWLRNELRPVLEDVFSPVAVRRRGLFDPAAMARVYAAFRRGEKPYMRVWALATLELWARGFLP